LFNAIVVSGAFDFGLLSFDLAMVDDYNAIASLKPMNSLKVVTYRLAEDCLELIVVMCQER